MAAQPVLPAFEFFAPFCGWWPVSWAVNASGNWNTAINWKAKGRCEKPDSVRRT
jgi:hypothetical protein